MACGHAARTAVAVVATESRGAARGRCACAQRVPLVNVTVNQDGALVVVRGDTTRGAAERVLDRPLGARMSELLPHRRDRLDKPARLARPAAQPTRGRGAPNARRRPAQNLVPAGGRKAELVQRRPEALDQQRSERFVCAQEPRASIAVHETENGDFVLGGRFALARNEELENRLGAIAERRLDDEGFGPAVEGPADGELPLVLEAPHELGKAPKPMPCPSSRRPSADEIGNVHGGLSPLLLRIASCRLEASRAPLPGASAARCRTAHRVTGDPGGRAL